MKPQKKSVRISTLLFTVIFALILPFSLPYAQAQQEKRVLFLNSYNIGYSWSDNILEGINSVFEKEKIEIDVHTEYMDTKRVQDDRHFQNLFELYLHKFSEKDFDLIITSDDNAFHFLLKNQSILFPFIPVVFCGVNNFKDSMLTGHKNITGVTEDIDIKSTIDIALKLHPKTKKVYVVSDQIVSGKANTEKLKRIIPDYEKSLQFIIWDNLNAGELKKELKKLPYDSIVLFLSFSKDRSGKFFSIKEQLLLITENAKVPVYTCWAHRIRYGVMGGMVVNGFYQGKTAAEMALRILKGERAEDIPVMKESPNTYMFDYNQLKRFNILLKKLPEGSIVLNRPSPFYFVYKEIIWTVSAIILFLLFFVFVLLFNIKKRKKVENQREVLLELNKKIASITSEKELLPWIAEQAAKLLGSDGCHYRIREGDYLVRGYGYGGASEQMKKERVKIGESLSGLIAKEKKPLFSYDIRKDPRFIQEHRERAESLGFVSMLGVPMMAGGEVKGVLMVLTKRRREYTESEVELLSSFADMAAIAIENSRLFEELKKAEDIVSTSSDFLLFIDKNYIYRAVNDTYLEAHKKKREEVIGSCVSEMMGQEVFTEIIKPRLDKCFSGKKVRYQEWLDYPDRKRRFYDISLHPYFEKSGNILGAVVCLHDITELKKAEEDLRQSEERFRQIAENINEVFWVVAPGWNEVIYISPAYEKIWGFSCKSLYENPRSWLDSVVEEDRGKLMEEINKKIAGDFSDEKISEYRITRPDGSLRWILAKAFPIEDKYGKIYRVAGIAEDITERKQREEQIKRKTDQLESLFETGKKVASITSRDDLLPWIAEEATSLLNADACYYRIREGNYLVYGGIQKGLESMLREKIKIGEGISGSIAKEKKPVTIPNNYCDDKRHFPEHKKKAKECGFQSCLGVPMKIGERVVGVLVVLSKDSREYTEEETRLLSSFADQAAIAVENAKLFKELKFKIDDQKRTEEALRDSERRLVEAQKIARVGDWDRNFKDDTATWSDEIFRIYGINKGSYDGTFEAFLKMVHSEDREALKDAINTSLSKGKPLDTVFRIIRPDGTERILNSKGKVRYDYSGEPMRMVGTVQDITEIKIAEEEIKKSLKEKEILLQEIHHRVKNNMQVISSLLTLQSASIEDKKTAEIFRQSQDRIRSMALIHEKLYRTEDFSRIDFKEYIETLTRALFNSYKKDTQRILLKIDVKDVYLNIETAIPLGLIINELISNSLKHAFKQGKKGELCIALSESGKDNLELRVRDNGVGIPDDFDIRSQNSLGFQIITLLAENQLRGKIKLNRNGGTEFQLTLKKAKYKKRPSYA